MSDPFYLPVMSAAIIGTALMLSTRRVAVIYPPNVGLLYRSGRFERELESGRHVFLDPFKRVHIVQVSRAPTRVSVSEIPVISKDQFSFWVSLSLLLEVIDARAFAESQPILQPGLFAPQLQLASHPATHAVISAGVIQTVGGHRLRDILANRKLVIDGARAGLEGAIPGVSVGEILLTSVVLTPETSLMFTDVERSRIEAEAALERAWGEQAALRALANTPLD